MHREKAKDGTSQENIAEELSGGKAITEIT